MKIIVRFIVLDVSYRVNNQKIVCNNVMNKIRIIDNKVNYIQPYSKISRIFNQNVLIIINYKTLLYQARIVLSKLKKLFLINL